MPRLPMHPSQYKRKFRHISLNVVYFNMLYEICNEYIGLENISQCLHMIIKDLYDTLTMVRSEAESNETKTHKTMITHKKKKREDEETIMYDQPSARPPPPP